MEDNENTVVTGPEVNGVVLQTPEKKEDKMVQIPVGEAPAFRVRFDLNEVDKQTIIEVVQVMNHLRNEKILANVFQDEHGLSIEGLLLKPEHIEIVQGLVEKSDGGEKTANERSNKRLKNGKILFGQPSTGDTTMVTIYEAGRTPKYCELGSGIIALHRVEESTLQELPSGSVLRLLTPEEKREFSRKEREENEDKSSEVKILKQDDLLKEAEAMTVSETDLSDIDWPGQEALDQLANYTDLFAEIKEQEIDEITVKSGELEISEIDAIGSTARQLAASEEQRLELQKRIFKMVNSIREWRRWLDKENSKSGKMNEDEGDDGGPRVLWGNLRGESVMFFSIGSAEEDRQLASHLMAVFDVEEEFAHVGYLEEGHDTKIFAVGGYVLAAIPPVRDEILDDLHKKYRDREDTESQDMLTPQQVYGDSWRLERAIDLREFHIEDEKQEEE